MMNNVSETHIQLAKLRGQFIRHAAYEQLCVQFDRHLQRRRAALSLGLFEEARGIAIVGASGSGKSTLAARLLTQHPDILQPQAKSQKAEVISLLVPSPATLKDVGSTILGALGYDSMRRSPAGAIWDQVRTLLHNRETLFVHLDEAQDLFSSQNANVRNDVVNTLKSLMNSKAWPVGLILSGTPKMIEMINSDDQLKRRIDMVSIEAVTWASHEKEVRAYFKAYADKAGLSICPELDSKEFLPRLLHAGANEFGLTVSMILNGIENAVLEGTGRLRRDHFIDAFESKSGCVRGLNPFVAPDYHAIDTRAVMGTMTFGNGEAVR
ncbi:ATP-binding protein [uncultured Litoreibacter sp.]|uniref:ATP-binding protein n=1 Tax=uncultured Litoreibacter sp. TaxID=1392394 RepID=UPI002608F078|nr:ATP-binding protein [uncultured Litoreibacter sp.]